MDTPLNLDWTALIGLLALGQAILLCLYFGIFHAKKPQAWMLVALFFSIIIALGHDVLIHSKLALHLPQMLGFGPFSTYLTGPLVFFIVLKTLKPEREFQPFDAVHALPFVVHLVSRWPKYIDAGEVKLIFLQNYYDNLSTTNQAVPFNLEILWGMLSFYGHRFLYLGMALLLLFKLKDRLEYACMGRKQFAQLMAYGLVAYCGGWLVLTMTKFIWPLNVDLMINSAALSLGIIALALLLFRYSLNDIFAGKSTQKYQEPAPASIT